GGAGDAAVVVEHAAQVTQLLVEAPDDAADHRVRLATLDHQRRDQARTRTDQALGRVDGHAAALGQRVVLLPVVVEARVVVDVGQLEIHALAHAQAEAFDPLFDHVRTANQNWRGQALVDHRLYGAQDDFFLALGVDHALAVAAG